MCGRFTLTVPDLATLAAELLAFPAPELLATYRPRYNIAPSSPHPIVVAVGGRRLVPGRWGLGDSHQINARGETAASLASFREAWARRRCVVPADGFFEWRAGDEGRDPIWLHPPAGLLLFAGLFDAGQPPGFAIVTASARGAVAAIHDRMPACVAADEVDRWLAGDPALTLGAERELVATPVSRRVNSVAHDDPGCLGPPEPPRQGRLLL